MPDTIQEQAGDALSRAGQRLAEAETGVRAAIAGLNQAIDAAHAAGIGPRYARAMVNSLAQLGALGRAYFNREIRSWSDIYESGPRPGNQNDSELLDLHARPRPQAPAFSVGWASSVPGTLARAGQELARAETGFDMAYARFSDATDFARYARIPAGQAASLVTALSGPLAEISRELVATEVDDWDAIPLDLASTLADGTEPPRFWAAVADARSAKGAGDYGAAAASWMLARDQLPGGHLMRDGLDSLISALHTTSGTGQHVACAGYIVHHSTEPPSSWTTGQLVEAVRRHAAGLGDDKQALRKVLDGWTDGAIAAAFDAARDPDEAVARTCLFATFERADQLRAQAQAPSRSGPAGLVQPGDRDAPAPQEMAAAYRAVHHEDAPWLTRQQWQAGQLSTATGTVLTAPWYLAAIAAKKDGRPMSAVPRYMAAAEMDATAGRLSDHRDPSGSGDDARDIAEALSEAAAAMRAGDLAEARSAITRARGTITSGSSLHRILNEHERPVINLASPARLSGPAASSARVTRRPSQQGQRPARGR